MSKTIFKNYTEEEALELVRKRYKNMNGKLSFTIQRLEKESAFKKTFQKMKSKSYPDWAVYMAIMNAVINYRINHSDTKPQSPEEHYSFWKKHLENAESESDFVVPLEELTEKKLEMAIDLFVMSFLKGQGYELRRRTPNIKRLREYAEKRYKMFEYDVPHEQWFNFEK